jgi:hypothetical protein
MAAYRWRLQEAGDPERLLADIAAASPALGGRLAHRVSGSAIDAIATSATDGAQQQARRDCSAWAIKLP